MLCLGADSCTAAMRLCNMQEHSNLYGQGINTMAWWSNDVSDFHVSKPNNNKKETKPSHPLAKAKRRASSPMMMNLKRCW